MRQTVVSVNGKKVSKKIEKAKYGGCKNPPFKFPVVSEVNSLGDSKPIHNRKQKIMANLNTVAKVLNTLASKSQLDKANAVYLPAASLWVFSIKGLIVNNRKQGTGYTLLAKKGYITTRQSKYTQETITLPYFQTTGMKTFAPKVSEGKVSAVYADLSHKEDGHEYPYNVKLNFTFDMCYQIALACLGESGIKSLVTDELDIDSNADPKLLLKGMTHVGAWWQHMLRILPSADIQIQVLCVINSAELNKAVVKPIHNTQEKALEFDINPHIECFQVVSSVNEQYIWGVERPREIVQVVTPIEGDEVTVYNSVEEIPYNSKQAEFQLRKLYVSFLKENESLQTNQQEAIKAFLAQVSPGVKLGKWLSIDGNPEKATKWLSKIKFDANKATKQEFEKPVSDKEGREASHGVDNILVIPPSEPKKVTVSDSDLDSAFDFGNDD